jgi:hypothetical protein
MSDTFRKGRAAFFSLILFLMVAMTSRAQSTSDLNVMPLPSKVQLGSGSLKIDGSFTYALTGVKEARLDRAGERFITTLHHQTGLVFVHPVADATHATLVVTTDHESKPVQELGED